MYYVGANKTWQDSWGGKLRLFPSSVSQTFKSDQIEVDPVGDRLVLFSSSMDHEVTPTSADCPERIALSAWYLRSS